MSKTDPINSAKFLSLPVGFFLGDAAVIFTYFSYSNTVIG